MTTKRPAQSTSSKMVTSGETHGYKPNPNKPAAVRPSTPPAPPAGQGGGSKK